MFEKIPFMAKLPGLHSDRKYACASGGEDIFWMAHTIGKWDIDECKFKRWKCDWYSIWMLGKNIEESIFPNFDEDRSNSIILTTKNDLSLKLNDDIVQRLPGQERLFLSSDSVTCDDEEEANNYPLEFLTSITPSGMPPHQLKLKIGCTVMLLRNICSKRVFCNRVRLKVVSMLMSVLHCQVLNGTHCGQDVLIPRLKLAPPDTNLPFILQRIQYPLRLCYAMTINKSQGQTFDHVGIFLPEPVFSHGQLYVAFSRARTLKGVFFRCPLYSWVYVIFEI